MAGVEAIWLALLALPGPILGAALGARLYRALSERNSSRRRAGTARAVGGCLVWSSLH